MAISIVNELSFRLLAVCHLISHVKLKPETEVPLPEIKPSR